MLQPHLNEIFSKLTPIPTQNLAIDGDSNGNSNGDTVDQKPKEEETNEDLQKENIFYEICTAPINEKAPPLFAIRFPDLFVY